MSTVDVALDHSRFRLWLDEDLDAAFVPDGWIDQTVGIGSDAVRWRRLAVEAA
jgi:hypothetical protein